MRTFVALELGDAVVSSLTRELDRLSQRHPAPTARWVKPTQLHLTLSFLGEVSEPRFDEVGRALAELAPAHRAFSLTVGGGGTFGPMTHPKVLWASVSGDLDALHGLQGEIARRLDALGFPPDHPRFEPHITLARAKHPRGDANLASSARMLQGQDFGQAAISEVALFVTEPALEGMNYHAKARFRLTPR